MSIYFDVSCPPYAGTELYGNPTCTHKNKGQTPL